MAKDKSKKPQDPKDGQTADVSKPPDMYTLPIGIIPAVPLWITSQEPLFRGDDESPTIYRVVDDQGNAYETIIEAEFQAHIRSKRAVHGPVHPSSARKAPRPGRASRSRRRDH